MAFVKRWKTDGHLSAIMKDATGSPSYKRGVNEVLERKVKEHTLTFLLG